MTEKALGLLGLMRKANAVMIGEEDTGKAAKEHMAKLLVVASDSSENARKRASEYTGCCKAPLITAPFTKAEISDSVGKHGCSMLAVCDIGFADAFMKILSAAAPDEYSEAAGVISRRAEDSRKRKVKGLPTQKNKRIGNRRNNA